MNSTTQPRQPAGARHGNELVAGRFAPKQIPGISNEPVGFVETDAMVEVTPRHDWRTRVVNVFGTETTFNRRVVTGTAGDELVSVTADCDDPTTLLLARKGDIGYWSGETWSKHDDDRRIWCSDIACRMLEEGLVATKPGKYSDYREGIAAATQAAGGQEHDYTDDPHALTAVVAQIRGLRVLQSMAGHSPDWYTTLNGWDIPEHTLLLRSVCFNTVARVYSGLCQPPWYPDDALWGPQEVAGYATHSDGGEVFVGEHGDLLWRALTETDHFGWSPLRQEVRWCGSAKRLDQDVVVAAALYDETAQRQVTTGLLAGVGRDNRAVTTANVLSVLAQALNPPDSGDCRWTPAQQTRIRGFVNVVEALKP